MGEPIDAVHASGDYRPSGFAPRQALSECDTQLKSGTDRAEEPKLCRERQCLRAILAAQLLYNIFKVISDRRFRYTRDFGYFSLSIALGQRAQAIPLPRCQPCAFLVGRLRLSNLDVVDPHEVVAHSEQIAGYRAEQ